MLILKMTLYSQIKPISHFNTSDAGATFAQNTKRQKVWNLLNPIMLVFIRRLSVSTLKWILICQGFSHFSGFLISPQQHKGYTACLLSTLGTLLLHAGNSTAATGFNIAVCWQLSLTGLCLWELNQASNIWWLLATRHDSDKLLASATHEPIRLGVW